MKHNFIYFTVVCFIVISQFKSSESSGEKAWKSWHVLCVQEIHSKLLCERRLWMSSGTTFGIFFLSAVCILTCNCYKINAVIWRESSFALQIKLLVCGMLLTCLVIHIGPVLLGQILPVQWNNWCSMLRTHLELQWVGLGIKAWMLLFVYAVSDVCMF